MAPKRKLEEIGGVVEESGAFRVRMWLDGRNVDGPRRGNQQRALSDLSTIRTAAAEHTSRANGLEAMQAAAKNLKEAAATEAGGVVEVDGEHRARVQYTDNTRISCEIKGPRRDDGRRAQADFGSDARSGSRQIDPGGTFRGHGKGSAPPTGARSLRGASGDRG